VNIPDRCLTVFALKLSRDKLARVSII